MTTAPCYTDDWQRTNPDLIMYLPELPVSSMGDNEHVIVNAMPGSGDLLATWTTGTYEASPDTRTVFSRSDDGGHSWTKPSEMPGTYRGPYLNGRWGFHLVSRSGRVYFFYNRCVGFWDCSWTSKGAMSCNYSDDDGQTWQEAGDLPFFRRDCYDHDDSQMPPAWIVWQPAIRDAKERWLVGFTRWSSLTKFPLPQIGYHSDSRTEFMRFDNLDEGPHPRDLEITFLPEGDSISVPCPVEPEKSKGYSLAEEPGLVLLPDGRLFVVMRTRTGHIWYSVSEDDGATWRQTEILCQYDKGPAMLNPKPPCPLYRLDDGRYLLFYSNHDGTGYGAKGPHDMDARRPIFISVGEFRPTAHQSLWFSPPKLLFDTHRIALGPGNGTAEGGRFWLAMYSCLTQHAGERIFWYPDRKHFLLGRSITDELLDGMYVPGQEAIDSTR